MNNKKIWTIGKGVGIGLIAIAISVSIVALVSLVRHELDIYHYNNCIEIHKDVDRCMPLINKNYYPQRAMVKPIPPEIIEDDSE